MGTPNWECADGRRGGPTCQRRPGGECGWVVVECEQTRPSAGDPPGDAEEASPPGAGVQDLGAWSPLPGAPAGADARLVGAATLRVVGDGLVSIGGTELRVLPRGARQWTVIQRHPGDNLYRVGVDAAGDRLVVAWEKDPLIHVFSLQARRHLAFPRPPGPGPRADLIQLESVTFSSDGGSALVTMVDRTGGRLGRAALWRVPLDGRGHAEAVVRTDGALLVTSGAFGAIFAMPSSRRERCTPGECFPHAAALVAWEVTTIGVTERTLLAAAQLEARRFRPLRTEDRELVAIEVEHTREGRSLLLYRPGTEPELRPLPPERYASQPVSRPLVTRGGSELVGLRKAGIDLVVQRLRTDGGGPEREARIPAPVGYDAPIYGFGLRRDGTLWLHWGDRLALLDARDAATGLDLRPLAGRMDEWAGVAIPVEATQSLWIGVEVGARRDYFRVQLDALARRALPWPSRPKGCGPLPDEATLLRWPVQRSGGCSGGMPNPRARPPAPPPVVKVLPDGSKIVDAGERGCMRTVDEPCRNK
jgi:hypothetical protein